MSRLAPLLTLLLASCWVHPGDYWVSANYESEYTAAWCDWMVGCFNENSGWSSKEACIEDQQAHEQDKSSCTYDSDAGRECVEAWWTLSCRAWDDGSFPEVCDQVYDCTE